MRALVFLPVLLASLAQAQKPAGIYQPAGGQPVAWSVNSAKTLIWGGTPYLPVGARVEGNPAAIQATKAGGVDDVIVELPAGGTGWADAIRSLEAAKMRYLIDISSLVPMARGYAIEPQAYSIGGITAPRKIEAFIPGATSVLTVLVTKRDNNVEKVSRQTLDQGRLSMDLRPLNDLEHILLIYPEMRSLEQPDLWEAMDEHRDTLVTSLKRNAPGPGLRGIVNPLGRMVALGRSEIRFVPSSPYFRYELRTYLEKKYRNVDVAQRAWSLASNELKTFDELARQMPLWAGNRGIAELWDPVTDKHIPCNMKQSAIWKDIRDVIVSAGARRYQRLTAAIRQATNVPVVQEWSGWASAYEGDTVAVDGIGARVSGQTPTQLMESAAKAASTVYRWKNPGWFAATDIDAPSDATQWGGLVDDLSSLGARAWYFRAGATGSLQAIAALAAQKATDVSLSQFASTAVFFPENAYNPAMVQRLASGRWWLPCPASGNRIDLGSQFSGYQLSDGALNYFALWTNKGERRVKLRTLKPKTLSFEAVDGSDPNPKFVKGGVEVTIGSFPLLVTGTQDLPVPEPAIQETVARFAALTSLSEKKKQDFMEERYGFADAVSGLDVNPSGSYSKMRQWFWRLGARYADYLWVEAEYSKNTNFSESQTKLGCSNSNVLVLKTSIEAYAQNYYADYSLIARSEAELELWVAAKIPAASREFVTINVGGQVLTVQGEGLSPYGDGFAWYKLGTTRVVPGNNKIQLNVNAPQGADLAIDTILFIPGNFRPNGVVPPDPIDFSQVVIKKG